MSVRVPCRTTALSHPDRGPNSVCGHLPGVARRSQSALRMLGPILTAGWFTAGCIVPEAPEYGPPRQTPVFVEADSIFPNPRSMQRYTNAEGNQAEFRMNVRSEDASDDLVSVLYLDYKHKSVHYIDHKTYKPQSFDQERLISWTHVFPDPNIGQGPECHLFTVTVLHAKGWDSENNKQIGTPSDLAAVSWYARFNDDQETALLSDCPDASPEAP